MLTLWKSRVIPILEYCSILWNPERASDIQAIELLQRAFLRKIKGSYHLSYWEILDKFCVYSLQRRREWYQIIYTWKVLEGQVPNISHHQEFKIIHNNSDRRGCMCRINSCRQSPVQSKRAQSISVKGPRLFNLLPREIRDMSDCPINEFKATLDIFLAGVPDKPFLAGITPNPNMENNNSLVHLLYNRGCDERGGRRRNSVT